MTSTPYRLREHVADCISKYGDYQFTIDGYRRRSGYALDVVVADGYDLSVPGALPSEPPEGVTYHFGDSGFDTLDNKIVTADGRVMNFHGDSPRYGNVALIPTAWKNVHNYSHWMVSELPYLYLAFLLARTAETELILVPDDLQSAPSPFAKETWRALHDQLAPDAPVVSLTSAGRLSARRLFIPYNHCSYAGDAKIHQAWYAWYHSSRATAFAIDCMRHLFVGDAKPAPETPGRKIYIARKTRVLKNEADIRRLVSQRGFEIVALEELSVKQQASLFQSADTVVGMHGAGLTNLVFCRKDTRVIELADPDEVAPLYLGGEWIPGRKATRTHYHIIAATRELSYRCIETPEKMLATKTIEDVLDASA